MVLLETNLINGPEAWSGPTFCGFGDAAVKLRWIDQPFRWHRNDGREFFLVLSGSVEMRTKTGSDVSSVQLGPG